MDAMQGLLQTFQRTKSKYEQERLGHMTPFRSPQAGRWSLRTQETILAAVYQGSGQEVRQSGIVQTTPDAPRIENKAPM